MEIQIIVAFEGGRRNAIVAEHSVVYGFSSINRSLFFRFFFTESESRLCDKVSAVRRTQYPQMALLSCNLCVHGYFEGFLLLVL